MDGRTTVKQYAPDLSMRGHKKEAIDALSLAIASLSAKILNLLKMTIIRAQKKILAMPGIEPMTYSQVL